VSRLRVPSPKTLARWHGGLAVFWVLLTIPAVTLWRDSVPFLVSISMCALVLGSVSSMQAARADANSPSREDLERVDRRVVALLRMSAIRSDRSGNGPGPAGDVSLDDRA